MVRYVQKKLGDFKTAGDLTVLIVGLESKIAGLKAEIAEKNATLEKVVAKKEKELVDLKTVEARIIQTLNPNPLPTPLFVAPQTGVPKTSSSSYFSSSSFSL